MVKAALRTGYPVPGCRHDGFSAGRLRLGTPQLIGTVESNVALRAAMARTAVKAVMAIQDIAAVPIQAATAAPESAAGRDRKIARASFQLRAAVWSAVHPEEGSHCKPRTRSRRPATGHTWSGYLRGIDRELDLLDGSFNIPLNVGQRASADIGLDVDSPRRVIVQHDDLVGDHPDRGDLAELDMSAGGGIEKQFTDAGEVVPDVNHAAHHYFEDLLLFKEVAHDNPLHQGCCGAPGVTGLDAGLLGSLEIDLDLHDRSHWYGVDRRVLEPLMFSRALRTSSAFSRRTGSSVP